MMSTKELQKLLKSAQEVTSLASADRLAVVDENGDIVKIVASLLQQSVFSMQATNLDQPDHSGIFSLYKSTGAKPADYGMVLNVGAYPSDIYQLALLTSGKLYSRTIINRVLGSWKLVGGKSLFVNILRNYAERRWVA